MDTVFPILIILGWLLVAAAPALILMVLVIFAFSRGPSERRRPPGGN